MGQPKKRKFRTETVAGLRIVSTSSKKQKDGKETATDKKADKGA